MKNNADRIQRAEERGKVPYWYRDNRTFIKHQLRTPEEVARIRKEWMKRTRVNATKEARDTLIGTIATHTSISKPIQFTGAGIKEAINQPHSRYYEKNLAVSEVREMIGEGVYAGNVKDSKGRNIIFHYIQTIIAGEKSYIVIKEDLNMGTVAFYSITDKKK